MSQSRDASPPGSASKGGVAASELAGAEDWICGRCGEALQPGKVVLAYMGSEFSVELPTCPKCGQVWISEKLAGGKMAEVERILEDK